MSSVPQEARGVGLLGLGIQVFVSLLMEALGIEQVLRKSNLNCCAISSSTIHLRRASWCYRLGALPYQFLFRQATKVELLRKF